MLSDTGGRKDIRIVYVGKTGFGYRSTESGRIVRSHNLAGVCPQRSFVVSSAKLPRVA